MTQRVLGPSGSRRRKTRLLVLTALAGAALIVFYVSAAGGYPTPAPTPLSGTFDTGNGDLTPRNNTFHDWNPVDKPTHAANPLGPVQPISCPSSPGAGTNCAVDWVNNSADNSFTQGTKEDDTSAEIGTGSIPPNKDDLSRFYLNQDTGTNGHPFLYLAWERSNLLGSAHMDFEFNQLSSGITSTTTGTKTLNRSAGDILIDFDFGGSGNPALTLHFWKATGAASQCEAANSTPCWGTGIALGSAGQASVNGASVTDYNPPPSAGTTLAGETATKGQLTVSSTFGEAAIDLIDSGVFSSTRCIHFGEAWLKSRSSGESFTSAMKDFIAPLPVNVTNCGEIKVIKTTDPADADVSFPYNTNIKTKGGLDQSCTVAITAGTPDTFSLNAKTSSTEDCTNLLPSSTSGVGNYTVGEGTLPGTWTFTSVSCSSKNGTSTISPSGSNTTSPGTETITLAAEDVVTCTYLNTLPKANPSATSAPSLIPNDTVTVKDLDTTGSASGSADRKMKVSLYGDTDTNCSGTPLFTQTFTVDANKGYPTTNDGDPNNATLKGYTISGDQTSKQYHWGIVYNGDTRNNGFSYCSTSSVFDESVTVTIHGKS